MVRASRDTACPGCRVAVVRRKPESSQWPRQKSKVLEVGGFKSADPRAPGVDGLRCQVIAQRASRWLIIGELVGLGHDRVLQKLVEITRRNHAKRVQVVLEEDVKIVAGLGLEIRIAEAYGISVRSVSRVGPAQSLCNILRI